MFSRTITRSTPVVARGHRGDVPHGPEVRVEAERFAQSDVHAREAAAHWRGDRTLERDLRAGDRIEQDLWKWIAMLSTASRPAACGSHSTSSPATSRVLTTALVTSGPIPSPGISVMVCFTMNAFTDRLLPTA